MVLAATALGTVLTIVLQQDPGLVLGVLLVLGTIAGSVAVRAPLARLLIPAPAMCWTVGATLAGAIKDRSEDTSKIGLLVHGGTWIADGFPAMSIATILAAAITVIRLLLMYLARHRDAPRTPDGRRSGRGADRGVDRAGTATQVLPSGPGRPPAGAGAGAGAGARQAPPGSGSRPGNGLYGAPTPYAAAPTPGSGPYPVPPAGTGPRTVPGNQPRQAPGGGPRPGAGPAGAGPAGAGPGGTVPGGPPGTRPRPAPGAGSYPPPHPGTEPYPGSEPYRSSPRR